MNDANISADGVNQGAMKSTEQGVSEAVNKKLAGNFYQKHRKTIKIILGVIILAVFGYVLFDAFYDYTDISWKKGSKHNELSRTFSGAQLELEVEAYDRYGKKIEKVDFESKDGQVVADNLTVKWILPEKKGKYRITAKAPSGKAITKEVDIFENPEFRLGNFINPKVDQDKIVVDTDGDGISDKEEQSIKTDKNKADTDGDGVDDGNEVYFGLDPNKKKTRDGIADGESVLHYDLKKKDIGVDVKVEGRKNIAYSDIDIIKKDLTELIGSRSGLYSLKLSGESVKATVKVGYSGDDNLAVYLMKDEGLVFEKLKSEVDKANKIIKFETKNDLVFLLGSSDMEVRPRVYVNILLDNSLSMYSARQIKERIDKDSTRNGRNIGNDVFFRRVEMSSKLIDESKGEYYFNVGHFAGEYVNLSDFSNDKNKLKEHVKSIKYKPPKSTYADGGTNIIDSLESALGSFKNHANSKFIILLTDGQDTTGRFTKKAVESIIDRAKAQHISICSIGLGDTKADLLEKMSVETGCGYYRAINDTFLENVFKKVTSKVNFGMVSSSEGEKLVKEHDTGFDPDRDGFNFKNFSSTKSDGGNCYGMAAFANLYYRRMLPMSLPGKAVYEKRSFEKDWEMESKDGYDLSKTAFNNFEIKPNDFKIKNKALKLMLRPIDSPRPADYWLETKDSEGKYPIKEEYKEILKRNNAKFITIDAKNEKYEYALVAIDDDIKDFTYPLEEKNLLNAIWRLHITQIGDGSDDTLFFSIEPDEAYRALIDGLDHKKPVVFSTGGHAVNAIYIVRSLKNPNQFQIAVYDNNYPNETRFVKVERRKNNLAQKFLTESSYGYKFEYDGEKLGVSVGLKKDTDIPKS